MKTLSLARTMGYKSSDNEAHSLDVTANTQKSEKEINHEKIHKRVTNDIDGSFLRKICTVNN